jgi:hypothetical protein
LQFRHLKVRRLVQIRLAHARDIPGLMTQIHQLPVDEVVLVFIVPPDGSAENTLHEEGPVLAGAREIQRDLVRLADGFFAPLPEHEDLGRQKVGVGKGQAPG